MRNTKRTPSSRAANERDTAATITSSERWAMSWNCWGVWFRGAEPLAAPEKGCEWTMTKPSTRWACGRAPIPGKEYQQQRSAYSPAVSLHPVQSGDAAKIGKSSGIFVQQVHLRKQGDRTEVRSPSRINPPHIGSMSSSERHCTEPTPTSYSTGRRTRPKQDGCRSRTTEDSRRRRPESAPPTTPR